MRSKQLYAASRVQPCPAHPSCLPWSPGDQQHDGDEGKLSWWGISDFWKAGGDGFVGTNRARIDGHCWHLILSSGATPSGERHKASPLFPALVCSAQVF